MRSESVFKKCFFLLVAIFSVLIISAASKADKTDEFHQVFKASHVTGIYSRTM